MTATLQVNRIAHTQKCYDVSRYDMSTRTYIWAARITTANGYPEVVCGALSFSDLFALRPGVNSGRLSFSVHV